MNISEKISLILVDKGFNLSPNYQTEKIINDASKLEKTVEEVLGLDFYNGLSLRKPTACFFEKSQI